MKAYRIIFLLTSMLILHSCCVFDSYQTPLYPDIISGGVQADSGVQASYVSNLYALCENHIQDRTFVSLGHDDVEWLTNIIKSAKPRRCSYDMKEHEGVYLFGLAINHVPILMYLEEQRLYLLKFSVSRYEKQYKWIIPKDERRIADSLLCEIREVTHNPNEIVSYSDSIIGDVSVSPWYPFNNNSQKNGAHVSFLVHTSKNYMANVGYHIWPSGDNSYKVLREVTDVEEVMNGRNLYIRTMPRDYWEDKRKIRVTEIMCSKFESWSQMTNKQRMDMLDNMVKLSSQQ